MKPRHPKFIPVAAATQQGPIHVNRNHWSQKDVGNWKGIHLREYFYDRYLDAVGIPHIVAGHKHSGMMNRVLKQLGGPHEVRSYIDAMFEMKLKNNTLEIFSSTKRLGEIREYLSKGTNNSAGTVRAVTDTQPVTPTTTLNALLGGE